MSTRGEALNNPGDIKISSNKWQGKVVPSKDPVFETFQTPVYGIRAIAKILLTDGDKGLNTVSNIIGKYAPREDANDTPAYITAVAQRLGVTSLTALDLDNYNTMYTLVKAIICQEDGECIYSDATINQALNLAGIYDVPKPALAAQPEAHAAAGAGTIAALTVASTAVQGVAPAIPLVQQIITVAPWVIAVMALAGAAYFAYTLYIKHKATAGV